MKITDLTTEYEELYLQCLEDWSEDMKESGQHRRLWFEEMKTKGLVVRISLNDQGQMTGFIQAIPVRQSVLVGEQGYFINCIWVHGHKQGIGDCRKRGIGSALLHKLEEHLLDIGCEGIAAWGLMLPFWMKASWFKQKGFKRVDRDGIAALMWKPLTSNGTPPKWRRMIKKPLPGTDKLVISLFNTGWCSALNITYERVKRIALNYPDSIILNEYNTRDRKVLLEWGISDDIWLDNKQLMTGPPPSYKTLEKKIVKLLKKKGLIQ